MKSGPLDIAVVGLGALFPGRGTTLGFWRDILEGVDALKPVPASHWLVEDYYDPDPLTPDRTYGARGGFIEPVPFDPLAFGIPPSAIEATDTSQLLGLIVADAVLKEAEAQSGGKLDRAKTSCVLGVASATELVGHMSGRLQRPVWVKSLREAGLPESQVEKIAARMEAHYSTWSEATFPGMLGNVVAGRVANRLDLGGSNYVTDAACASSLSALQIALLELTSGDSDTVLCGGVDALNDILMYMCFSKTPALSPTGDCRPFSDRADGTMLGEGVGILALRRLADAEADGNRIHAVIKGLGGGSDGRATAIYAPRPEGQARAIERAYARAGYGPETVELVEAHGTGTKAGDAAELAGLKLVFGEAENGRPHCAIGSVKSQIGHTKAAAGAASLSKVVMGLSRRVLPPTLKVDRPAKALEGSPFYVNTQARPWVRAGDHPRRAGVSSFGFGGSNFHVTVEEYIGANRPVLQRVHSAELVLFSGADAAELARQIEGFASSLNAEGDLSRAADSSHASFDRKATARAAIVAANETEAQEKARKLAALLTSGKAATAPLPAGCTFAEGRAKPGKVAFLLPGQGSQYVGMGRDLALSFPQALAEWDRAASHDQTGPMRLHDLAFPPKAFTEDEAKAQAEELTALRNAQPALAAATLAHLALMEALGVKAEAAAGHSFGEVMALHVAGALKADEALSVARQRAACMAEAAEGSPGAMLAVQAGAEEVAKLVAKVKGVVVANDNAPTQTVLSGPVDGIEKAEGVLAKAGLKTRRLPVASAFHSEIVSGAIAPFAQALEGVTFRKPKIPVYSNARAEAYPVSPGAMRKCLSEQIGETVRFREMVLAMAADGFDTLIEVGPGTVVSMLARQCLEGQGVRIIATDRKGADGLAAFLSAVGELAVAGHKLNLAALYAGQPAPEASAKPPKHAVWISGANYNKPYPPKDGARSLPGPNPERETMPEATPPTTNPQKLPEPELPESETGPVMSERPKDEELDRLERIYADMSARHSEFLQMAGAAHGQFMSAAAALIGAPQTEPAKVTSRPALQISAPAPKPRASGQTNGNGAYVNGHHEAQPAAAATPPPAPKPQPAPAAEARAAVAPAAPAPRPAASAPAVDMVGMITGIVADKTGYPADMLDPDMDLEGELGVDSIKQVEILSTVREAMPDLPEIDPSRLSELRSIAAIAGFIGQAAPAPAPKAVNGNGAYLNGAHAQPAPKPAAPPAAPAGNMIARVTALIAEKTGYPEDMLDPDMDLEGELGVDSIKQVEILSALKDEMPDLPEVDPSQMAELRSIRKIADFFG